MNLSSTIKSIQDIMRKDDGVDGDAQRIGQLTWMLFLKVFDQREEEWEEKAKSSGEVYVSSLPDQYRWRNWAAFVSDATGKKKPQKQASELISFVNNSLFPAFKGLDPSGTPIQKVIRQVFEDSNNYMKSGTLMNGVIEKLDEVINFRDFTTRQNLGDVYEQILSDLRGAGNAGEFYTPRAITQIMVKLVNPRLKQKEKVMDPACGTGGILTASLDHFRSQLANPQQPSPQQKQLIETLIAGFEKKQLPHLLCTTNLLLHGMDVPDQADRRNTLGQSWASWSKDDEVACVITNPPFGGMEDEGVGSDYPDDYRTRETADMFLTLIVKKLLKKKGRAAIVLPDGALFGDGIKARIKEMLMDECNLHTIIRLPNGVFAPYTNIKANLLFFTKGRPTETIWFYDHLYPPGQKSYSKTRPIRLDEFDAEKAWWGNEADNFAARVESACAWKIDFKTKKTQAEAQAKPHWDDAKELTRQIVALEQQVRDLRESLKGVKDAEQRKPMDKKMAALRTDAEVLRREANDAQAAGDRMYWPIYNLDIKNPNTPPEEARDADELLKKYKKLLDDIEKTQMQLKNELGAALAHHFEREGA